MVVQVVIDVQLQHTKYFELFQQFPTQLLEVTLDLFHRRI
jgi:hypothetical protein